MALSANRIVYGIHSMAPYRRTDGLPYGILKVLGGGQISLAAEFEDLFGGSNKFQWASEAKTISSEFTATVKSMPDFLFELYLGASSVTTAASASGTASSVTNKNGTSVVDASTGITATVTLDTAADLKTGLYVVKAVSATTVDVYVLTDIDFQRGTDVEYDDDLLKITTSPLTIVASTPTAVPGAGLSLNGGAGTIGMTTNDTAVFKVSRPHGGISELTIGESGTSFPEHGIVALAAPRSDGSQFEIEILKAVGAGFPIGLEEVVFSIPELTVKLLYDEAANAVAIIRAIAGE